MGLPLVPTLLGCITCFYHYLFFCFCFLFCFASFCFIYFFLHICNFMVTKPNKVLKKSTAVALKTNRHLMSGYLLA